MAFSKKTHNAVLLKELLRKSIHVLSATVTWFARRWRYQTLVVLFLLLITYSILERRRLHGIDTPIISNITRYAARKEDNGKFVLGPVTLVIGIMLTLLLFPYNAAHIGIWALAFGDGLASLVGKVFGRIKFRIVKNKSLAGSTACFFAVFFSSLYVVCNCIMAFYIACVATILEIVPLKNFDNVVIPVGTAFFVQRILPLLL